jgi:hypothetical protein
MELEISLLRLVIELMGWDGMGWDGTGMYVGMKGHIFFSQRRDERRWIYSGDLAAALNMQRSYYSLPRLQFSNGFQ